MRTPLREKRRSQAGLSMIEIVVTMVILTVVGTMLVGGWISLQRSFAFAQAKNTARASARDALARVSSELRACQPQPAATQSGPFTSAGPYECVFYSSYNQVGARADGTGTSGTKLLPTRIYLDQTRKKLWWQRETNGTAGFTDLALDPYPAGGDRRILLANNVVNASLSPTVAIFTYYSKDASNNYVPATSMAAADLKKIVSVEVRLIVDANLAHTPSYVDLKTTVRPRNAVAQ
jgi:type II secretory pathway pseudopilin PulG